MLFDDRTLCPSLLLCGPTLPPDPATCYRISSLRANWSASLSPDMVGTYDLAQTYLDERDRASREVLQTSKVADLPAADGIHRLVGSSHAWDIAQKVGVALDFTDAHVAQETSLRKGLEHACLRCLPRAPRR